MAICKAGGGLTDIRGSISGNTFTRNRSGMILRSRTVPTNTRSTAQSKSRSLFAYLNAAWHNDLTDLQRSAWTNYANTIGSKNKLGETVHNTGHIHFVRANQARITSGLLLAKDGPTILLLPEKDPTIEIAAIVTSAIAISFDDTQPWCSEDGSALSILVSRPQPATKNYFNGPWRFAGTILGSSSSPPASPAYVALPFSIAENQQLFAQARLLRADGRASNYTRLPPKIYTSGETFTRGSIAYLDQTEYAVNVKRTQNILITNITDGAVRLAEGEGGVDITPHCIAKGIFYGISSNSFLYSSPDGVVWTKGTACSILDCLYTTRDGNLLKANNTDKHLYRSTNGGASFTDVYTTLNAAKSTFLHWSYAKSPTTMMLCEYGPAGGGFPGSGHCDGRYIYRSADDGITWAATLDGDTLPDMGYHWHTVGWHAATSKWLAFMGDGATYRKVVYSDDDGTSWHMLYTAQNCMIQPVCSFDYADPTKVFFGDDFYAGFGTLNVVTGEIVSSPPPFDKRASKGYCWSVAYYDGLYYACHYNSSGSATDTGIYVSPDLTSWSVYHRFAASEAFAGCMQFIGFIGGKLHFVADPVSGTRKHFAISPATASLFEGTVITPGATNLLNTVDLSSFETSAQLFSASTNWTVERVTSEHYHGAACIKAYGIDADISTAKNTRSGNIALVQNKTYVFEFRIKSSIVTTGFTRWYKNFSGPDYVNVANNNGFLVDKTWRKISSYPYTVPNGASGNYELYIAVVQGPVAQTVYIDSVMMKELPVTKWQIGGAPSAADVLTSIAITPPAFINFFALQTLMMIPHYAAPSNLYIRTWLRDTNNYVTLYYNTTDSKFYLQRFISGAPQAAVSTAAQFWQGHAVLNFALQSTPAGLQLILWNGKAAVVINDSALPKINATLITIIDGDINSSSQFPGIYANETLTAV